MLWHDALIGKHPSMAGTLVTAGYKRLRLVTNVNTPFRGLTKSQQQEPFRRMHPIKLKRGIDAVQAAPLLPSDIDPYHTYGSLPAFRSMETIRMMGYAPVPLC